MRDAATPAPDEPETRLDPEDEKLLLLARSAAARATGPAAAQGAAVRDEVGRTYLAGAVRLATLDLSAVQAAVAQAVASGVTRLEAAAVVGTDPGPDDLALLAEVGDPVVLRP